MLVIALFHGGARPVLVHLAEVVPDDSPLHDQEAAVRLTNALVAAGYQETPSAYAVIAPGADLTIGDVDTTPLADTLVEFCKVPSAEAERLADALDCTDAWMSRVSDALADLVDEAEAAIAVETSTTPTAPAPASEAGGADG